LFVTFGGGGVHGKTEGTTPDSLRNKLTLSSVCLSVVGG